MLLLINYFIYMYLRGLFFSSSTTEMGKSGWLADGRYARRAFVFPLRIRWFGKKEREKKKKIKKDILLAAFVVVLGLSYIRHMCESINNHPSTCAKFPRFAL